jgi:glycosyltransferase involved in cell wall biosynthesis
MRIGIDLISDSGKPSGVHTYATRLIEALLDALELGSERRAWTLVVFAHDDFQWQPGIERRPRLELVASGLRGLGAMRRRLLQQSLVPKLARRHRVDLVHSLNNVLPLGLELPAVLSVLDLSAFVLPERFGFLKRSFLRWAMPRSALAADAVIAISEHTRKEVLARFGGVEPSRVHSIPLAADTRFHPRAEEALQEELRLALRLPQEFLLYVGAAEPGKNLPRLAGALARLKRVRGAAIPWVLAGTAGPPLAALGRRCRALGIGGDVIDLGTQPAEVLPHLYRLAKAFAFPSLYEGFGLPLLEAMACGAPCIASGGASALAEVAGRAAQPVDPKDEESIAAGIRRVWEHTEVRELLRARGLARAREFGWEKTARRTLEVYEAACGLGSRHRGRALEASAL